MAKKENVQEVLYPVSDFVESPDILGTTKDIISAAFKMNHMVEATVEEAKAIVNEFKERKVQ